MPRESCYCNRFYTGVLLPVECLPVVINLRISLRAGAPSKIWRVHQKVKFVSCVYPSVTGRPGADFMIILPGKKHPRFYLKHLRKALYDKIRLFTGFLMLPLLIIPCRCFPREYNLILYIILVSYSQEKTRILIK